MKEGNWVPMSKALAVHLPKTRAYSRVEAAFSLQMDYDVSKPATIAGYAALWGWSRNKVSAFLKAMGVILEYPQNTRKMQNQKGQIQIQIRDRSWADNGQIRIIDSKWLSDVKDRLRADSGQIMGRSKDTTKDPNPNSDLNNNYARSFLLKDGSTYHVDDDFFRVLKNSYQNIDIESQIKKLSAWCHANPSKRKTKSGATRFVNAWMQNAKPVLKHQSPNEFDFTRQFHEE